MKSILVVGLSLLLLGCEMPYGKWETVELHEAECGDLYQGTVYKMVNKSMDISKYEDTATGKEVILPVDCSLVLLERYDE